MGEGQTAETSRTARADTEILAGQQHDINVSLVYDRWEQLFICSVGSQLGSKSEASDDSIVSDWYRRR